MLTLNPVSPGALPKHVVWNPDDSKQCEEAQARIEHLRNENYYLVAYGPDIGFARLAPKELPPDSQILRILDETGDKRLVWSYKNPLEVQEARTTFEYYMKRGYSAYTVRANGARGSRVESFDSLLEMIQLAPEAPPKPLRALWRSGGSTILVPPTMPG